MGMVVDNQVDIHKEDKDKVDKDKKEDGDGGAHCHLEVLVDLEDLAFQDGQEVREVLYLQVCHPYHPCLDVPAGLDDQYHLWARETQELRVYPEDQVVPVARVVREDICMVDNIHSVVEDNRHRHYCPLSAGLRPLIQSESALY